MNINRRKEILNYLYKNGAAKVRELAVKHNVNDATIRRDLKYLAQNYEIQLTYGGAFVDDKKTNITIWEHPHETKKREHYEEKQMIAQKAASLIHDGDTIALNAGTTVEFILDYIVNISRLNIITLCINIALKAAMIPSVRVYIPGGKIRNSSGVVYGCDMESFLKSFSVNKCFMGVAAVDLKKGITHPVMEEVAGNKILLAISQKKYLLADSSKYDCVSLVKMADISDFHSIIVDDKFSSVYRNFANINHIEII